MLWNKYLVPMISNMKGFGILHPKSVPPFRPVRTLRNAPHNNFVVTLRGTYVYAVNVTGS